MVRDLEAVYENGLLRPLEPLALAEMQRVHVTITDVSASEPTASRQIEQKWLSEHGREYPGQWLALHGDVLLSHGMDAHAVRNEARRQGVPRPLMVRVPDEPDLPSAGWL